MRPIRVSDVIGLVKRPTPERPRSVSSRRRDASRSRPRLEGLEPRRLLAAPSALADHYVTPEDVVLDVPSFQGVLANDIDPDGDLLQAVLVSGPASGSLTLFGDGSFLYRPDLDASGPDGFVYRPWDGSTPLDDITPITVQLYINPVDEPPIGVPDAYQTAEDQPLVVASPGVLVNDASPNGSTLTALLISAPSFHQGAFVLNSDGSFTYTPQSDFSGADSFTYRTVDSDGLAGDETTVALTIVPVSDAPTAVDDAFSLAEDQTLFVAGPGVLGNDTDPEGDLLSASVVNGPGHGTLTLNSDGSFTYAPDPDFFGVDSFRYRVSDGVLPSGTADVALTIAPVEDAPDARDEAYVVEEDGRLTILAPGVLLNDGDRDGDALQAVLAGHPQNGSLTLNPDGSLSYVPDADFVGTDSFTYRAGDGSLLSDPATATITVTAIPPTTLQLDSASDTGSSRSDRITRDDTPTFHGTTRANLQVRLFAQAVGSGTGAFQVGAATADSSGNWRITAAELGDGGYTFSAAAFRADGQSTGVAEDGEGLLTIDTVAPVVVDAFLSPKTGQVYVTFRDDRSGLDPASLADVGNYSFNRIHTRVPRAFGLQAARPTPAVGGAQTVVLDVFWGRQLRHGRYLFTALGGGVADLAGNALDGEFGGGFPSGDGAAGGAFQAGFLSNGRDVAQASATSEFVAIVPRPTGGSPRISSPAAQGRTRAQRNVALTPAVASWKGRRPLVGRAGSAMTARSTSR